MKSGLDRVNIVSTVLLLLLVAGNIFFSVQYIEGNKREMDRTAEEQSKVDNNLQKARFLKFFIDTVLNTNGTISYEDRVKLESDLIQLQDADLTLLWQNFVGSKSDIEAQGNVVKLMSMIVSKMI